MCWFVLQHLLRFHGK
uniref:Uncharacterized protein n=1 Tax=Anguilla anguilla TaxID=7936 RepID=A0A0E9QZK2_ANGAN